MRIATSARLLLPIALAAGACGDDGAVAVTGGGSSTSDGSATSDGTGGSGPSGPSGPGGGTGTGSPTSTGPSSTSSGASQSSASQSSSDASTGVGGSGGSGGGGGAGGGGGGTPGEAFRFVALGDGGEPGPMQSAVALVVDQVCRERGGCAFAVYLGDNMYDDGVSGVDDPQFQDKFELPYSGLSFPFKVVLGNHDYGGDGAGWEADKAQHQVDYTQFSAKWQLPSHYYVESIPNEDTTPGATRADFFGLDTNAIMWGNFDDQQRWFESAVATSDATWKIVLGHHPYISNGRHGNAGEYEGIPFIPIVSGIDVRDFVEDSVCGNVDLYLSGHDHNRQWLAPQCGVEFVVSGTAAKVTDLVGRDTDTLFETDESGGFLIVEIEGDTLSGDFYDETGVLEFSRTVTK
jgi:tartrate-resistant acid phosphatase type 5